MNILQFHRRHHSAVTLSDTISYVLPHSALATLRSPSLPFPFCYLVYFHLIVAARSPYLI